MIFNQQLEQNIIGAILHMKGYGETVEDCMTSLKASDFYFVSHKEIFVIMKDLISRDILPDLESVNAHHDCLASDKLYLQVNQLALTATSGLNLNRWTTQLKQVSQLRTIQERINSINEIISSSDDVSIKLSSIDDIFSSEVGIINESDGAKHISECMTEYINTLEKRWENPDEVIFTTGIPDLDDVFGGGLEVGLHAVAARPKMGKALGLSSDILLSSGKFKKMGDIQVGDSLASIDGEKSLVSGVYPQGERGIYKILLSDGRDVKCDLEHLWSVESSKFKGRKVVTTKDIIKMISTEKYTNRLNITSHNGEFGYTDDIGIDPWLLGALLGDGSLTKIVKFTNSEPYIVQRVESCIGDCDLVSYGGIDYGITGKNRENKILNAVQSFGLIGCKSQDKFIPEIVFTSNRNIREQVLVGLIETDGWVEKKNTVRFCSASNKLSLGVIRLVHSLGGCARLTIKKSPKFKYKGEIKTGLDSHSVSVSLEGIRYSSPRINKNLSQRGRTTNPVIRSVVFSHKEQAQCIKVTHNSKLFLMDNYVVTHNTELMGKMVNHFAVTRGLPVYVGSLEMSNSQVIERLVSSHGRIDKNQIKNNFKNVHDHDLAVGAFMHSCGDVGHSDVYIQDSSNNTPKRIRREARKILKAHGKIGGVFIDYLGLCDADGKHDRHDLAIGSMTKAFKALSKELNCPVILLLQLSRKLESRTDKRPIPSDSRDSGSIEQDVDSWTGIYRDSVYNEDSPWNGITEIIVRLNRHGGTGTAYQAINGAGFSNVSEHEVAELLHMEETKPASNKTSGF